MRVAVLRQKSHNDVMLIACKDATMDANAVHVTQPARAHTGFAPMLPEGTTSYAGYELLGFLAMEKEPDVQSPDPS